jgi:hypothetical protein
MSGPSRFEHKPTKVKWDRLLIPFVVGLMVLGIVISLLLAHYGWVSVETP